MERKGDVPYIVYESTIDRLERMIRRMWILCIIMFVSFVVSNGVWIWYENQFENSVTTETTVTQSVESDGDANISGTGDVILDGDEN